MISVNSCHHVRILQPLLILLLIAVVKSGSSSSNSSQVSSDFLGGSNFSSAVYMNPTASVSARVSDLLSRMTLREKIGQMIMDAENTQDMAPDIGAYLIGASDPPQGNNTPPVWRARMNALQQASANHRLGIPLFVSTDAVHGQSVISGGTIFPHNIGLGAMRNTTLLAQIADVTAAEILTSGLDMTFAPTLAVAQHISWGRTYESYSQDSSLVSDYATAFISNLQQSSSAPWQLIATAKHWVGDGATNNGTNAGDCTVTNMTSFLATNAAPFSNAINDANVGCIMISFSSVNGVPMHQNTELITNVLKTKMGFQGMVLSDWDGFSTNTGQTFDEKILQTVNAGIDMIMCPYAAYVTIATITNLTEYGLISESRINDAASRILRTKFMAGLFEKHAQPLSVNNYAPLGSEAHRAVARQAVRESLVLLKNNKNVLPISKAANVVLTGKSANNITNQCGGWTMSWQGNLHDAAHQIVGGTTIYEGFQQLGMGSITLSADGTDIQPSQHDVAVVVIGELPYAETAGDNFVLSLDSEDQRVISTVKAKGIPMVVVLISGRPLIITNEIQGVEAVVAAWLPGTEGLGIAQVLYGDYDFSGKLSFSWPQSINQVFDGFIGDNPNVLYPFGYGLNYSVTEPMTDDTVSQSTLLPLTDTANLSTRNAQSTLSQPGTPYLTASSISMISFAWDPPRDGVNITKYDIYDAGTKVGSSTVANYTATNLPSGVSHMYTVVAFDAAGDKSPESNPLVASTQILVSNFNNGSTIADNGWGVWSVSHGGANGDGYTSLNTEAAGYQGYGAELKYVVDSGSWGYSNMFLCESVKRCSCYSFLYWFGF